MRKIIKGFPADPGENYQLNVTTFIKHAARNFGRQELITRNPDGTLFRYTYRDSYERMKRLANALESIGVKVGDRVAILAWNSHKYYEIFFGLPGMGGVMITLNLRLQPSDIGYVVNHSGSKFIIVDEDLIQIAEEIAPMCDSIEGYIINTDKSLDDIKTKLKPIFNYEELLSVAEPNYEWPNLDENSAYAACYTSGTTGRPKGVYYSHRNVYLQSTMFACQFGMSVNDVAFQMVPMFHALGWSEPQAATYVGAKIIFSGKWNMKDLGELTKIMVKEGVTISAGVPTLFLEMLEIIRKMDEKLDLKGARFVSGGTEPPISLMKGLWDLGKGEIVHSYGLTEAMAISTLNMFKPWLKKELSEKELWELKKKQGYFVTGIDVKIIDENGNKLPYDGNSIGELCLRGPWITRSYYRSPEANKRGFTEDGYLKTGDVGSIDPEGNLKITDRIKDVIKSGGEWISTIDMENLLISHPKILHAAVVGLEHPKWDERPLALVILRDKYKKDTEKKEILEHLLRKFAKWQLPDEILFLDTLPRTSVGKVDKKALRLKYKDLYMNK
ncbi:MAG: long-chain-fatty-acid--CoA ligase [Promethearchaeota archaeon]